MQAFERNHMNQHHLPQLGRLSCVAVALVLTTAHAQVQIPEPSNYTERQTFKGKSFFKDTNIWVYNQAFADLFRMPSQGVSTELKGVEAAAFRLEDRHGDKNCGLAGKEDNCFPGGAETCTLDLYIDEAKYPLPWREPEQKANWVSRYSSLFWIRGREETEFAGGSGNFAELTAFVDRANKLQLNYYAKTDREFDKRHEMYGSARYTLRIDGFRRYIVNQLTLVNFSIPCFNQSRGNAAPSAHYLYLSTDDGLGLSSFRTFHQATLPLDYTERMNALIAKRSELSAAYFKSILFSNAPTTTQPQGDKK
jgi:hypothetical protein